MFEHDQVIQAQFQTLAAARAKALGDYESARINDDPDATMYAADRILDADQRLAALDRIAQTLARSQQQQPQGNAYGLSDDEVAIAKGISGNDKSLTEADRLRIYAEQRAKYQHMRQTGQYRDDQGVVRR